MAVRGEALSAAERATLVGYELKIGGHDYVGYFAALGASTHLYKIFDETDTFNCIAWSVSDTSQWINPPSVRDVNGFYKSHGYSPCTAGDVDKKIAVYMDTTNGVVTHAARRVQVTAGGSTFTTWTSKCGASYGVSHDVNTLNSDGYGVPSLFFK